MSLSSMQVVAVYTPHQTCVARYAVHMIALGILACCQVAPAADAGAESIHLLLDAAVRADLEPLKRALATEHGRREIVRTVDGISVVHMLLGGLHTAVAGEISRLVGWAGEQKHRTLYRHELIEGISAQVKPVLVDILRLSPQLVHAADAHGRTPLHVAASESLTTLATALLEAGARADARDQLGESAIHNAAVTGDADGVQRFVQSVPAATR